MSKNSIELGIDVISRFHPLVQQIYAKVCENVAKADSTPKAINDFNIINTLFLDPAIL